MSISEIAIAEAMASTPITDEGMFEGFMLLIIFVALVWIWGK